jgi:hypothetical protein
MISRIGSDRSTTYRRSGGRDMPGASAETRRVKAVNANWTAGADDSDGRFEILLITDDDERHALAPSPAAMSALLALAKEDHVVLWDRTNRTLIVANIMGTYLPRDAAPGHAVEATTG